ncbi:MAG: cytochrome C [Chitinophagaceae bacterium]|nr:cytochrome C [Rubrivivax sp.]
MNTQKKRLRHSRSLWAALALLTAATAVSAREPFTPAELKSMEDKLTASVKRGYDMWYGARADMANNGLACANCHPDAAATNPQTFPKFLPVFNKVVPYRAMVNWCIENPQGGKALDINGDDMTALESYSFYLHKGVKIQTGLVTRQTSPPTPSSARGFDVKGTGIGFDK